MKKNITRKDFLHRTGALAAIGIPGLAVAGGLISRNNGDSGRTWPWPYSLLDVENVRIAGHDSFWLGKGCSFATFHAIVNELRSVVGSPYTEIPSEIMIFGHGGGAGWGTLCGALSGAAAAMQLVCNMVDGDMLVSELIGLYTQSDFPSDISNTYAQGHTFGNNWFDMPLPQSQSNSPLCHVSTTKWVELSAFPIEGNERNERCARLSGDVAAMAVALLNAHFEGSFTPAYVPPSEIAYCLGCHGPGTMKSNVFGKMDCMNCHIDHTSSVKASQRPALSIGLSSPNPFSSSTRISFMLAKDEDVSMHVYDLNGMLVRRLLDDCHLPQGEHEIIWDGRNEHGASVKPGMYIFHCRAGRSTVTRPAIRIL